MRRSRTLASHALQPGEYHELQERLTRRVAPEVGVDLKGADADEAILRVLIHVAKLKSLKCDDIPEDAA